MQPAVTMPNLTVRLQWDSLRLGHGKAALLVHIKQTGSIAAAGRDMGISYKRAWMLIEEMNHAFSTPLVTRARGGLGGGRASLTETGDKVLQLYQQITNLAQQCAAAQIAELGALLAAPTE